MFVGLPSKPQKKRAAFRGGLNLLPGLSFSMTCCLPRSWAFGVLSAQKSDFQRNERTSKVVGVCALLHAAQEPLGPHSISGSQQESSRNPLRFFRVQRAPPSAKFNRKFDVQRHTKQVRRERQPCVLTGSSPTGEKWNMFVLGVLRASHKKGSCPKPGLGDSFPYRTRKMSLGLGGSMSRFNLTGIDVTSYFGHLCN